MYISVIFYLRWLYTIKLSIFRIYFINLDVQIREDDGCQQRFLSRSPCTESPMPDSSKYGWEDAKQSSQNYNITKAVGNSVYAKNWTLLASNCKNWLARINFDSPRFPTYFKTYMLQLHVICYMLKYVIICYMLKLYMLQLHVIF